MAEVVLWQVKYLSWHSDGSWSVTTLGSVVCEQGYQVSTSDWEQSKDCPGQVVTPHLPCGLPFSVFLLILTR